MKTIRHTATLVYYDGVQVFEGRDSIGGHYLGVLVEQRDGRDQYLVTGVAPERLRQFRSGTIDLRSVIEDAGREEWFLALAETDLDKPLVLVGQKEPLADSGLLPDAGFLLHERPADATVLAESRARNNLVLEIAVEPPEAAEQHRIRVDTLAGVLIHVQTVVKHAYAVARRDMALSMRRADVAGAHLLDVVVPAAPGSFRIVLEAATGPDLLGHTELSRALARVDELFALSGDPARAVAAVKAHRGHFAGAYLRLLRFLLESKTGFRYAWAEPALSEARHHAVTEGEAGPLVEALSGVSNLGSEPATLLGELDKADRTQRTWRMQTGEGAFSGKTKADGPSLDGLKVGGRYRFHCLEEIEVEGVGREQRTLYLVEHEPA